MAQRNGIFGAALVFLLACSQADEAGRFSGGDQGAGGLGTSGNTGSGGGGGGDEADAGPIEPPEVCDELGSCGDYSRGCTDCAVKGPCLEAYEGCFNDKTCVEFNMCMAACKNDVGCQNTCATANPLGAERYNTLVTCIVCDTCKASCEASASICP
ncbi:hypothetical protein [Polyangium spumosum]|uniref:Uncharacterized protein n=1 Tax=Polyangium spumosum TaxID=889282 RepID=A0A6N7PKS5_9BACT|nr:hypothetical protein [Polyangium spumosum]MRG92663.1 hypothetical protein [Polyangium spumosum]